MIRGAIKGALLFAILLTLVSLEPGRAATVFFEDFSDNSAGWTLGPEWAIGSATASAGHVYGGPDPASDHTPTADNGVAGVVIGGNASLAVHPFYYLTSPAISVTGLPDATLEFYRWLNSDYTPYMQNIVEVFDGVGWHTLWITGGDPGVQDSAWTHQAFDITAYQNANLMLRFGFQIDSGGVFTVSSWNLDDVSITSKDGSHMSQVPEPATSVLFALGLTAAAVLRRRMLL
jgi:hypothetical protein